MAALGQDQKSENFFVLRTVHFHTFYIYKQFGDCVLSFLIAASC